MSGRSGQVISLVAHGRVSSLQPALAIPALALLYFASAKLGLALAFLNPSATPVWPPAGIAVAAAILGGARVWPGVFIGAFFANLTTHVTVATALGIAAGNTIEAVLGAYLVNRFAGGASAFEQPLAILKFAVLSAMASTLVSATIGVTSLALGGSVAWADYDSVWLTWWLGDAIGNLVVAPPIILWATSPRIEWTGRQAVEAACLVSVAVLVGFGIFTAERPPYSVAFVLFPVLMWAAFRFGLREAATASLLVSGFGVWGTLRGLGPFVPETAGGSPIVLQAFSGINAFAALILSAVIHQRKLTEDRLRVSEKRFRAIFEQARVGVALIDTKSGRFIQANPCYCDMLGLTPEEMTSTTFMEITHADDLRRDLDNMEALTAGRIRHFSMEKRYRRADGSIVWVDLTVSPMWAAGEEPNAHVAVVEDITKRKETEELLRTAHAELENRVQDRTRALSQSLHSLGQAEQRFRGLLEAAPDAMVIVNERGQIALVNSQAERLFGYSRAELLGRPVEIIIPSRLRERHPAHRATYFDDPRPRPMGAGLQLLAARKDGTEFPVEVSLSPLHTDEGLLVSSAIRDVTERRVAEEKIRTSLRQQEVLLKEIHHRVKNNLAVISSLLYLESVHAKDEKAARVFEDSQRRVRSMSLVHETLYGSDNLGDIDFAQYARVLAGELGDTYQQAGKDVRMNTDLNPVRMSIDLAVPCGLILNELISNAFKHGFPDGESGDVRVTLRSNGAGVCVLQVEDTGVGPPNGLEAGRDGSLGLRLIRSLARQIHGSFELVPGRPGTRARVTFAVPEAS